MKTKVSQKGKKTMSKTLLHFMQIVFLLEKKKCLNISVSAAEFAQRVLNGKNHFDNYS